MGQLIKRVSWWRNGLKQVAMAVAALVTLVAVERAPAQGFGGNPFEKVVLTSDIDKLAKVAKLDESQQEQAKDLLASFDLEFAAAAKKVQESMQSIMQEYQDNRDPAIFQDMVKQTIDFQEHGKKLRDNLFSDIKLLLTPEQMEQWDRWERRYRRDQSIRQPNGSGLISGDAVELVSLVEDLKLTPEQMQSIEPMLDQYENEVDRIVVTREKLQQEQTKESIELMSDWMGNMPRLEEMFAKSRELLVQLRDVNAKYYRQVLGAVPEDKKSEFEKAYNVKIMPQVYRDSYVTKAFDTAKGMEDLSADQKTQVEELRAAYQRELASANEKWAVAIREYEVNMKVADLMSAGNRPEKLRDAQTARRDLDIATYDKLAAVLTEEQRGKLPPRGGGRASPTFQQ